MGADKIFDLGEDARGAYFNATEAIRGKLRNPDAAQFPKYQPSYVQEVGPHEYKVSAWMSGTNLLGVAREEQWSCLMRYAGHHRWACVASTLEEQGDN